VVTAGSGVARVDVDRPRGLLLVTLDGREAFRASLSLPSLRGNRLYVSSLPPGLALDRDPTSVR